MLQRVVIVFVVVSLCVTSKCSAADADVAFYSHYDGKQYKFIISEAQLARCPKWDPAIEPNPPHPAAKALEQARQFIATVPTKGNTFWRFEDLALVQVSDSWVWRVRYRLERRGGSTGVWPYIDCVILMDGTSIQPKITSEKVR